MNKYFEMATVLFKAGVGEGAHGGHVIGHTRSGKPIYASSSHPEHHGFSAQDHTDAMNHHYEIWSKTNDKIAKIKEKKPNWNPPKEIGDFLQHHRTHMAMHQNRANTMAARQRPTNFGVISGKGTQTGPFTPKNIHKGLNDIEVPFLAAVVVISPDRKRVLLGKRSKDKGWESPAGHADIGEHPEDVVIRECFEEFNIPLKPEQLEHLPMMYKKDMTPVHVFMAVTEEYQVKNISCEDDPSEEHSKWKWFKLNEKLPEPMEDNRFNSIIHAKMKLAGIGEMSKSFMPMDALDGMSQMHTTEFAEESAAAPELIRHIEHLMEDYKPGDIPVQVLLVGGVLHLVKVDDGLYSGFVKKVDRDGLEETVANIDKMTLPSMVQYLRAKQLLDNYPFKTKQDEQIGQLKNLLDILMPKTDIPVPMIYVSMDGDNIGNRVAEAEAKDDEETLKQMSRKIQAGQLVFETWTKTVGGTMIESGGDEGLAKVPETASEQIEAFREQYHASSGATVTVGVGKTISQSTRARELGKLKGKDRVEVHGPGSDHELMTLLKPKDEAQKIRDSGVLKSSKLERLVKEAMEEIKNGSEADIELETARKWAARAIAAARLGKKALSEDFAHEALEHAALVKDRGETVAELQKLMEDGKVSMDIEKSLLNFLQSQEDFHKGESLAIGSIRGWNGMNYRKEATGHWMPVAGSGGPTPDQTAPASDFQPPEEERQPAKEVKPEVNHLKHLKPREGGGGHVTVHSRDLKNSLDRGPFSIISAGRNDGEAKERGMTDEQVSHRSKKLEEDLKDSGHKYTKVKGKYNGASKDSFMVFHAEPEKMDELAKKHGQESVLHSSEGKNRMHFVNGKNEGKHHKGSGHEVVPEAEDNHSEISTSDGKKVKFVMGMDYGKMHGKP